MPPEERKLCGVTGEIFTISAIKKSSSVFIKNYHNPNNFYEEEKEVCNSYTVCKKKHLGSGLGGPRVPTSSVFISEGKIIEKLKTNQIISLEIYKQKLSNSDITKIVEGIGLSKILSEVFLEYCSISAVGTAQLVGGLSSWELDKFSLGCYKRNKPMDGDEGELAKYKNKLEIDGAEILVNSIKNKILLSVVDLRDCQLDDESVKVILNGFKNSPIHLYLSGITKRKMRSLSTAYILNQIH